MKKVVSLLLILCWGVTFSLGTILVSEVLLKREEATLHKQSQENENSSNLQASLKQKIAGLVQGQFVSEGLQEVDLNLSENEINDFVKNYGKEWIHAFSIELMGKDEAKLDFKLTDEVTFLYTLFPDLKKYEGIFSLAINAPIQIRFHLTHVEDNKVMIQIDECSVATIKLPANLLETQSKSISETVNRLLSQMKELKIEQFEMLKDAFKFKGIIPEKIILALPQENS